MTKPEEKGKPAFVQLKEQDEKESREREAKALSIKQRLLNRLRFRTVPVPFEDENGEFTIEVRLLSPAERRKLSEAQIQAGKMTQELMEFMTKKKDEKETGISRADRRKIDKLRKKLEKFNDVMWTFLAKICVDPELDKEFWEQGEGFNEDVPRELFNAVIGLSSKTAEDVRFLRDNLKDKGSSNS